ncbi:MAG TPA: endonuclease MutS2 [Candidatus Baltobacteraceae bacterium]|jgi:DNA mismatch repair protein MutS2|nr:endonuclease MutS2 [Candidatus Baltobacteraceae bacterium]
MSADLADSRTLETLDFAGVRERVVANTRTERGRRLAEDLCPFVDFNRVKREQIATAQMRELIASADFHILPAIDTGELTQRAGIGTALGPTEIRAVGDAIGAAAAAYNKTREQPSEVLDAIAAPYRSLREVQRAIVDAIDERGVVLERASHALGRIRKNLQHAQAEARDRVSSLLRSFKYAKAIQDAVVTIREGRFVVPIKAEFSGEVPGIVHDTSSSGQTLFVEPLAALDANNRVRTLRLEEEREIARILSELSQQIGSNAAQIEANVEMLAQLDLLAAKASVASAMDARAPELVEGATLCIRNGRHPLLGDRAVPQSVEIDDDVRLIVISGPNMGGKTVALKMVGLFVCMVYCGMQIPVSDGSRIGCFTRIFADIGDEQSIAENTSTFSAHLRRMREIIAQADERSLVLVDEIGGGTEPTSGAALAVAMLERLLAVRAGGIVTTHSTELKLFAHQTPGVSNASVRFDPQTFAPTYHLDIGMPGQSLAFPLARSLGIPGDIIARADALLGSRERDYESALAELSSLSAQLESEREGVERERRHVDRLQENLRSRTEALERERREFSEAAEARMQQALRDFTAELARRAAEHEAARPKVTSAQSALLARTIEEMRRDLGVKPDRAPADPGSFAAGDRVRVLSFGQDGTVIADNGDTVLVAIGPMKSVVAKTDVQRASSAVPRTRAESGGDRQKGGGGSARMEAAARTMAELDVRGKRYIEAEPLVDQWIDEAVLAGNSPLRLIHGKGTGLLGRGLQEFLRAHPSVKNVRYGDENEGGGGVTIFDLR